MQQVISKYSVLLVEDNIEHAGLIKTNLQKASDVHTIDIVHSLKDAQHYLSNLTPDMIFINDLLPDGSGLDLLKDKGVSGLCPVVIMTGQSAPQIAVKAIKAGALDCIVKSLDVLDQLPKIVKQVQNEWHLMCTQRTMVDKLKQSETQCHQLFEIVPNPIIIYDRKTKTIINVNQACLSLYGYSKPEFLKISINDIVATHFEINENDQIPVSEEPGRIAMQYHRKKNNSIFPVEITSSMIDFDKMQVVCSIVQDLSQKIQSDYQRKFLEDQLYQSQKLEAVGTLAGGIAHDFNNILSIILGNAELAAEDVSSENAILYNLDQIIGASLRGKDVVWQLLSYSRKTESKQKIIDIDATIEDALKLLRATIPTIIDIQYEYRSNINRIMADPAQIHQVIVNLCTNAWHAMEEKGGVLSVMVEEINVDGDRIDSLPKVTPGQYIVVKVNDSGCGIDPMVASRVFEPYFTTKKTGKGSGMGLAVAHGIVSNHGGGIMVESEPDRGSTFSVYLPVSFQKLSAVEPETGEIASGNERILFIDDEPSITFIGQQMLSRLGYRVEVCNSPGQALELFRSNPQGFDLIITDMTMPQMTARTLIQELKKIKARIPIIVCTGYSDHVDDFHINELGISNILIKPITRANLSRSIREALLSADSVKQTQSAALN